MIRVLLGYVLLPFLPPFLPPFSRFSPGFLPYPRLWTLGGHWRPSRLILLWISPYPGALSGDINVKPIKGLRCENPYIYRQK
jgi:hypothetical protein